MCDDIVAYILPVLDLTWFLVQAKPKDGPLAELLKEFATPVVTTLTNGKKSKQLLRAYIRIHADSLSLVPVATIFPLEPRPRYVPLLSIQVGGSWTTLVSLPLAAENHRQMGNKC